MASRKWEIWEIVVETVTAVAVIVFFSLQMYYAYVYKSSMFTMLYRLLPVALLYGGMSALQRFPEMLNGGGSVPLQGLVRVYAVRMVRNSKCFVVLGMLIPSAADVLGARIDDAFSLTVMCAVLGTVGYYLFRIYQYNKKKGDHS